MVFLVLENIHGQPIGVPPLRRARSCEALLIDHLWDLHNLLDIFDDVLRHLLVDVLNFCFGDLDNWSPLVIREIFGRQIEEPEPI